MCGLTSDDAETAVRLQTMRRKRSAGMVAKRPFA